MEQALRWCSVEALRLRRTTQRALEEERRCRPAPKCSTIGGRGRSWSLKLWNETSAPPLTRAQANRAIWHPHHPATIDRSSAPAALSDRSYEGYRDAIVARRLRGGQQVPRRLPWRPSSASRGSPSSPPSSNSSRRATSKAGRDRAHLSRRRCLGKSRAHLVRPGRRHSSLRARHAWSPTAPRRFADSRLGRGSRVLAPSTSGNPQRIAFPAESGRSW